MIEGAILDQVADVPETLDEDVFGYGGAIDSP